MDALMAILEADTGLILGEHLYQEGLALERLLEDIGGKRSAAIEIIRELIRQAGAKGAAPASIQSWSYFTRLAKMEMAPLQVA